jgi:heme A synthase
LLLSTTALIALGGLVRITGSGLGCPDWPLCHGRLIPPFELAPWIEYMHRLAAATVSVELVAFTVVAWWRYRGQAWVIVPASIAPLLLVAQILLGRLTVLNEIPPTVAWIHTAVAMAILACVAVPVCAAYGPLRDLSERFAQMLRRSTAAARLPRLLAVAALAVYILLLTGAYVTRAGASGACTGFPACGSTADRPLVKQLQEIHMLHRLMAAGTAILVGAGLVEAWRAGRLVPALRGWAVALGLIFVAQVGLGISNVLLALPLWSRGLHLTVAAVLWAAVTLLTATLWQGLWLAPAPRPTPVTGSAASAVSG